VVTTTADAPVAVKEEVKPQPKPQPKVEEAKKPVERQKKSQRKNRRSRVRFIRANRLITQALARAVLLTKPQATTTATMPTK
jgi:hypothetical protein